MKSDTLNQLLAVRAAKRPVVLATWLDGGREELLYPGEAAAADGPLMTAAAETVRSDKSTTVETDDGNVFLHVFNPPLRMAIVGAVHIAQPLSQMAVLAGYDVTVIDPRGAFASEDRFPGINLSDDWPDEAMAKLAPDARTAVVLLTHDPKLDDPALAVALKTRPFYIGALGSSRTHAKRKDRLAADGFTDQDFARIHGPVGLAIGAKSPAEIAVAIMAQVTEVLRRGAS